MVGPFVSPLFIAGEILFGLSLVVFVGASIATIGDRITSRRR
jgi:hypothetical protein